MKRIKRFTPAHRLFHLALMLSFVFQSVSGLARMYIGTEWGRFLANLFGGFQRALTFHKWVGLFMLAGFGVHLLFILIKIDWRRFPKSVYGPDSLLPRLEDASQALQHVKWLVGMSEWPRFDRWGYWEKFDYWAVSWGICVLGGTGLLLYIPVYSSLYMPGWVLNIVLWIHRIEAILAMAHVFIIHLFIGHLRRHNFPMDLVMFEGSVALEKVRHERPDWVNRMEKEGKLQEAIVDRSPQFFRVAYYIFGFAMIGGCLYLLVNGLTNASGLFG